jgi:hypothetical protein
MADAPYPGQYSGGNANYDFLSALYYRYLVSGDLDRLADAHHCAQYAYGFNVSVQNLTYANGRVRYAVPYEGHAALDTYTTNYTYATTPESSGGWPWGLSEWFSGFHADMYNCYCLSGWPQALGTLAPFGLRNLIGPGGFGWLTYNYDATIYGGRYDFRLMREPEAYYVMLNLPESLRWDTYWSVIAPPVRTVMPQCRAYLQAKCFDSFEAWSLRFDPSYFLHGVWGTAPKFGSNAGLLPGTYPNFQGITFFTLSMLLYLNLIPDDRVPEKLVDYASVMAAQARGPVTAWYSGRPLHRMPYLMANGDAMDSTTATSFYTTAMLVPLFTYAWRVTGDPQFLTLADAHATHEAWVYDSNRGSAGAGWKQMGEVYHMAFPAAAWRAGVPHDGWTT